MLTFDRPLARLLLETCRYTYAAAFNDKANTHDKDDALSWIRLRGGISEDPEIVEGSGTSVACITSHPDRNIVTYMGTKTQFNSPSSAKASFDDWMENFKTVPVPFELTGEQLGLSLSQKLGGLVHKGFLEELAAVQCKVVSKLLKTERGGRSRPVIVTGHSQGGAEAILATRALVAGGFTVASTYTFAAPRAGNRTFSQSLPTAIPLHRIEFGDDLVPHVPPTMVGAELAAMAAALKALPFLTDDAKKILDLIQNMDEIHSYVGTGNLCYGSNKTKSFRVDMSIAEESALFKDRLWSLIRHPERWFEHHHLAGTSDEVRSGIKGNYTALVSDFQLVA